MGLFDLFNKKHKEVISIVEPKEEIKSIAYQEDNLSYGVRYPVINKVWDGEKTLGELGAVVRNIPDYERLRLRSYDAYATKDVVKSFASKYFIWTISSGLRRKHFFL